MEILLKRNIFFCAPNSHELDLLDPASASKLRSLYEVGDHIVILAGLSPYRGFGTDIIAANMQIAKTIRESLNDKVWHVTYVSSDAVYGEGGHYVTDNTLPSPSTPYGVMHLRRELLFKEWGGGVAIARPTMVFGEDDPHRAYGPNKFLWTSLQENKITLFGYGEELRDYIEVSELAYCLVELSLLGVRGSVNLVSGSSCSFLEIAETFVRHHPATTIEYIERKRNLYHREYKELRLHEVVTLRPKGIIAHIDDYFQRLR